MYYLFLLYEYHIVRIRNGYVINHKNFGDLSKFDEILWQNFRTNSPATVYSQLCDAADQNKEPIMSNQRSDDDEMHDSLKQWHNSCASNVLLSSLMSSTSFPQVGASKYLFNLDLVSTK